MPDLKPIDFVIITPLAEERDAVLDLLPGHKQLNPTDEDIQTYYRADIPVTSPAGKKGVYRVIIMPLIEMGRIQATASTKDAIRKWSPRYVLLVGIAGGFGARGVKVGDLIVSKQIVDYELQKITADGPEVRWEVYRPDPRLIGAVQNFKNAAWRRAAERPEPGESAVHFGPILSGDKVIAVGEVLEQYAAVWPKLVGVEMEAGGMALSAFQTPNPPKFFMIRGVSDLADEAKGSAAVETWRSYACGVAAAYTVELLKSGPVTLAAGDPASTQGNDTDKKEEEEERTAWRAELRTHYKNLRALELQEAKYGSLNVPVHILNQIDEEEAEIARLEMLLGIESR